MKKRDNKALGKKQTPKKGEDLSANQEQSPVLVQKKAAKKKLSQKTARNSSVSIKTNNRFASNIEEVHDNVPVDDSQDFEGKKGLVGVSQLLSDEEFNEQLKAF